MVDRSEGRYTEGLHPGALIVVARNVAVPRGVIVYPYRRNTPREVRIADDAMQNTVLHRAVTLDPHGGGDFHIVPRGAVEIASRIPPENRAAIARPDPAWASMDSNPAATETDIARHLAICCNCGSTETLAAIRLRNPQARACCPERKMVRNRIPETTRPRQVAVPAYLRPITPQGVARAMADLRQSANLRQLAPQPSDASDGLEGALLPTVPLVPVFPDSRTVQTRKPRSVRARHKVKYKVSKKMVDEAMFAYEQHPGIMLRQAMTAALKAALDILEQEDFQKGIDDAKQQFDEL